MAGQSLVKILAGAGWLLVCDLLTTSDKDLPQGNDHGMIFLSERKQKLERFQGMGFENLNSKVKPMGLSWVRFSSQEF